MTKTKKLLSHQFNIWEEGALKTRAVKKIISPERLREVQDLLKSGRDKDAVIKLRDIREKLENYCNSIR